MAAISGVFPFKGVGMVSALIGTRDTRRDFAPRSDRRWGAPEVLAAVVGTSSVLIPIVQGIRTDVLLAAHSPISLPKLVGTYPSYPMQSYPVESKYQ